MKEYERLSIDVIEFDSEDVIATSVVTDPVSGLEELL